MFHIILNAIIGMFIASILYAVFKHLRASRDDKKLYKSTQLEFESMSDLEKKRLDESVAKIDHSWEMNHHH